MEEKHKSKRGFRTTMLLIALVPMIIVAIFLTMASIIL